MDVPAGTTNPWDAIIGQAGVPILEGETYELSFDASSGPGPVVVRALVQDPTTYATFTDRNPALTPATQRFSYTFTAASSLPGGEVQFQIGGASAAWVFCVDNVSLVGGAPPQIYVPNTGPRVRVNQLGYLPHGPKGATLVSATTTALGWQLVDAKDQVVASGQSLPKGIDPSSGLNVHEIRFDAFHGHGTGYRLVADGETSHPFEISAALYQPLFADAMSFFYTQRSGIAIEGAIAGAAYARAAGHLSVAPNLGDYAVPCQPPEVSLPIYGEPWTCDYALDVPGGWYDAGDHGKYVVNAGISVAQLLATFERSGRAERAQGGALGDGSLRVPERGNGVPDVLDEARWELSWMLSMQVPAGKPLAGMVHHKVHDNSWTGLPLAPANDDRVRELHRPSTAATLNLAAVAAQGARIYARYDRAFAARLLTAAKTAWDAAIANPALYAPAADGASGGGPYNDSDVSDEFYWAAAELFLTTGERAYQKAVLASPQHTAPVFNVDGFSWGTVAALGRMDLATQASRLPDRARVRRSVLEGADAILAVARAQAWGQPYAPAVGGWVWGSNSLLLNNLMLLGTAYDLSGEDKYKNAAIESLDYLLGRNALNISYITGYGEVYSQNQHSRIYAAELNAELPHPPKGSLAGGANSNIEDPVAQENLAGCVGQFCYIDEIGSWSTNEVAINWNATLAWAAAFVANQESCW
jgi:endoglucanase